MIKHNCMIDSRLEELHRQYVRRNRGRTTLSIVFGSLLFVSLCVLAGAGVCGANFDTLDTVPNLIAFISVVMILLLFTALLITFMYVASHTYDELYQYESEYQFLIQKLEFEKKIEEARKKERLETIIINSDSLLKMILEWKISKVSSQGEKSDENTRR